MNIYQPAEDSYFLTDILKKQLPLLLQTNPGLTFLEIGAGSGIHLETAYNLGIKKENISSCDINKQSVYHCNSLGFKCVYSDLFKNLKGKWDMIIFNPPYLPEHQFDKEKDTSGGKKGDETIIRFLQQAKNYLNKNGRIFLLLSSQTPMENIKKELKIYHTNLLGNERLFYEELFIYELTF
jgi:release factor glutamine methyltransferase